MWFPDSQNSSTKLESLIRLACEITSKGCQEDELSIIGVDTKGDNTMISDNQNQVWKKTEDEATQIVDGNSEKSCKMTEQGLHYLL